MTTAPVHGDGPGALRARAGPGADHRRPTARRATNLAEAFVHTFKRDYVNVHERVMRSELRVAESVLAQLGGWSDNYNRQAPHSALGMRSPADYREVMSASRELTPPSVCKSRRPNALCRQTSPPGNRGPTMTRENRFERALAAGGRPQ